MRYTEQAKKSLRSCAGRVLHGAENRQFQGRGAGFVGPEAYTTVGTLSKKKKMKSRIQNLVRK